MSLKGGYTRYEVEHISCNLLLYIGKTELTLGFFVVDNFRAFQVTWPNPDVQIRAEEYLKGSNIKLHYTYMFFVSRDPPFNIQKEKSRKIIKSRSRNHSHEFNPVVAPSFTHFPSFVTCLEYGVGGMNMKILRYFVISPLVHSLLNLL